jgi:uncharacterized protein
MVEHVHAIFRAVLLSPSFPCLGGTGLVRAGEYCFAVYDQLGDPSAFGQQAVDMRHYFKSRPIDTHPFAAFVAAYIAPSTQTDDVFEACMWAQLEGLQSCQEHGGQGSISLVDHDDPGFVFGDREFFVVGMHPGSSRFARRFPWPLLVFNALSHAHEMQKRGKHASMSRKVLARDRNLQGSDNPSLHAPQRLQFSGREVADVTGSVRPSHVDGFGR